MGQAKFNIIGQQTRRKDGIARVTGQEQYTVDIDPAADAARPLRRQPVRARAHQAAWTPAPPRRWARWCITWDDVPHIPYNERIVTVPWVLHKDHYVLADKVRRMGEAVAAVAAETEELAERAARAVVVEYEPLPVVTDPMGGDAAGCAAALRHRHPTASARRSRSRTTSSASGTINQGDVEQAFAEADVFVEGHFKTPKIYHMQMEPKTAVCKPEPDGGLTVWAPRNPSTTSASSSARSSASRLSKIDVRRMPRRRHVRLQSSR